MNIQKILLLEDVAFDLEIGEVFYEKQSKGLGGYFKDSILSDIESLWLYGGMHQKVFGVYRLLSKRFPYGIYYEFDDDTIIVIAVLDLQQNPNNICEFLSYRAE